MSKLAALFLAVVSFFETHLTAFSFEQGMVFQSGGAPISIISSTPQPKDPAHHVVLSSSLTARAVLVVHMDSGAVIADRFAGDSLPIASLTKIMTGFVALEELPLDTVITISADALKTKGQAGGFISGEQFLLRDLLVSMMMYSSNDAAMAVAQVIGEKLGGTTFDEKIEKTTARMNARAKELRMNETFFVDPVGLDISKREPGNRASASDIAILAREVNRSTPLLWELSRDAQRTIYSLEGRAHDIYNTNQLVTRVPHFVGGKTGSTDLAYDSLVLLYEYPLGHREVLVLLGADPGRRFEEAEQLVGQIINLL